MKVEELVKELSKMNPNSEVIIQHDEHGWHGTDEVREVKDGKEVMVSINWHE